MRGKGALSVTPGQQVQVTGVIKIVRGNEVLLTRLVQASGQVYKIRNEHGFAIMPASRRGISRSKAKGGQL
jgi:hypothetical protein